MSLDTSKNQELYSEAWLRLQHVLSFFDRVDTKLSLVLGINVAMIGVLATQVTALKSVTVFGWSLVGAYAPLCILTFFFLYRGSFPRLDGGEGSLIYFGEIATRTKEQFSTEFIEQAPRARLEDVLEQVRHNACIAMDKYQHLRWAYRMMGLSLIPWVAALGMFATL